MNKIDLKTFEKINGKLNEISDISSCVKTFWHLITAQTYINAKHFLGLKEKKLMNCLKLLRNIKRKFLDEFTRNSEKTREVKPTGRNL